MRISTSEQYNSTQSIMSEVNAEVAELQKQIASGEKIDRFSDNPPDMLAAERLDSALKQNEQYIRNISLANVDLGSLNNHATAIQNIISSIQSEMVRASSPSLSIGDKRVIAEGIEDKLGSLFAEANSTLSDGSYLFSGSKSSTQPFIIDSSGNYVYQGDQAERDVQINALQTVSTSASGFDVFFVDSPIADTAEAGGNAGNATIGNAEIINEQTWSSSIGSYYLEFSSDNVTVYSGTDNTGSTVKTVSYSSGEPIEFNGLSVTITGTPVDSDGFSITPSPKKNIFDVISNLATDLKTNATSLDKTSDEALKVLTAGSEQVVRFNAEVGNRQVSIDDAKQRATLENDGFIELRSTLVDTDLISAISELQTKLLSLQAAQQTFSLAKDLTLLSYI